MSSVDTEIKKLEGEILGCEWWVKRDEYQLFILEQASKANKEKMEALKAKLASLKEEHFCSDCNKQSETKMRHKGDTNGPFLCQECWNFHFDN